MKRKSKIVKSFVTLACAGIIACGACGCSASLSAADVTAWGTNSLQKVLQEEGVREDASAFTLNLSVAKGESESAQVIVTPSKDVKSLTVEVADLTSSSGAILSSACVDVYLQRYIEVIMKTYNQKNEDCPVGFYPDMLLPMDIAVEYGENKIIAGRNQGITFDFAIPENQTAGIYTGTFKVKLDNVTLDLPVTVKVWNFALSKVNGQTLFQVWRRTLINGEMDNSYDTYKTYYEYVLNEMKSCLQYLPFTDGAESMAECAIEYWDHPNFTTFAIPTYGYTYDNSFASNEFYNYLYALIKRSTPERILTDKAVVYLTTTDEPHTGEQYTANKNNMNTILFLEKRIVEDLAEEGFFNGKAEFKQAIEESLSKMAIITTSSDVENRSDYIETYCPPIQHFETTYMRELYEEHSSDKSGKIWMYTCMQPIYPYPSHHIDDFLVGARALRWMQKRYDLDGYLYWGISEYYNQGNESMMHPYEDASRYTLGDQGYNGEGYWLYPGDKYGSETPFPSVRSFSVRDAQEDYDMLCLLEEKLAELSTAYGENIDADKVLREVYDKVIFGSFYNTENEEFFEARQTVAEYLENIFSCGAVVYAETNGSVSDYKIFAEAGSTIKINGNTVTTQTCGSGVCRTYRVNLDGGIKKVNIEVNGLESNAKFTYALQKVKQATDFASGALEGITTTENSSIRVEDGKLVANIVSYDEETLVEPNISFNGNLFEKISKIDDLIFTITNTGSVDVKITVNLSKGGMINKAIEKITIKTGETRQISINRIFDLKVNLSTYNSIRLSFDNLDKSNNLRPERQVTVDEVYYTTEA